MRAHTAARECSTLYAGLGDTPALILGPQLILDLDGDLGVSLSVGKVSAWADQSARGNSPSQPTAARRPTATAALNGHTGIAFAGASNQWLVLGPGFTGIAAGDRPRIYVIGDFSGGTVGTFLELSDSVAANRVFNLYFDPSGVHVTFVTSSTMTTPAQPQTSGAKRYEGLVQSDGGASLHITDVATSAAAHAGGVANVPSRMTVGILGDAASFPLTGAIYRLIIANPTPAQDQHAALVKYFKARYALA